MIHTFDLLKGVKDLVKKDLDKSFVNRGLSSYIVIKFLVYEKIFIGYNGHFVVAYRFGR